ncbi:MAG TPA: polysaccharide deacetylase family protein, partial [Anaerolineales bacterium]
MRRASQDYLVISRLPYSQRLKGRFGSSLVAYWPLWEPAGTSGAGSVKDITPNARHGTPSNVTFGGSGIGDHKAAAAFSGVNSYINVYSTSLRDAFPGLEGSLIMWIKAANAGVWTDGTRDDLLFFQTTAANSFLSVRKNAGGTGIEVHYLASAFERTISVNTNTTDWFCLAVTWSDSNDRLRVYLNGLQHGEDATIGTWGNLILSANSVIGAVDTTGLNSWNGQLAHVALINREATAAEIAGASSCGGFRSRGNGYAMLCFDDSQASTYTGLTYLKDRGRVATIYTITGTIGNTGYHTAAHLLELDAAGFAIANHTHSHTNLTTLTEAQQETELSGGRTDLEALGLTRASRHVAYPNGASNADTLTAMAAT